MLILCNNTPDVNISNLESCRIYLFILSNERREARKELTTKDRENKEERALVRISAVELDDMTVSKEKKEGTQ